MAFPLSTPELQDALRISESTIRRLRREGVLKPGVHYRNVGVGVNRPRMFWNPEAVDQALANRTRQAARSAS
jgi:hypothetical protein